MVVALAIGLAIAGGAAGASAMPTDESVRADLAAAVDDGLESAECPVEVPGQHADRVTCGVLVVPERRTAESDPEKTLRLPVVVIESHAADPFRDPLVVPTTGGPGAGTLSALGYFLDHADWAADDRDIILVEQRGDAEAEPSLDCPELGADQLIVDGVWPTGADAAAQYDTQLQACHDRLVAEGIDLAAYTSAESAADLVDLRTKLGYDTWNLYGVSYGARLAMTMMRDHPEGLRSVILDGPYPPDVNRYESLPTGFLTALDALFASCADAEDCHDQYPDLETDLATLLDDAAANPIEVEVKSPVDGSEVRLDIRDTDITGGLFNALYDANLVRVLPFVIDQLSRGNADSAVPLAQQQVDAADSMTEGLYLSVECAEEAPFNDPALIDAALAADPLLEHFVLPEGPPADCPIWAVPALAAVEDQGVSSGIPTLITSGGYDPVAPLPFAEAAAAQLSTRYLYEFPTMGHGSVWANWVDECPASIAQQFLRDPLVEPDSSCIAGMPPTDFLTTDDIYPTTAIYRFNADVVEDRNPLQIGIAVLAIGALAGTLVYALVYGISWLLRRRGDAPPGVVLTAATASGLYLAYAAALGNVVINTDPLILAFGVPPSARPLIFLPLVAIAVTILLTVVVVRAWIGGDGTRLHRILLSISAGASVVFALWLVLRGLLIF
jgi:pimeloyl-ACP methyl ester carboxylesterase